MQRTMWTSGNFRNLCSCMCMNLSMYVCMYRRIHTHIHKFLKIKYRQTFSFYCPIICYYSWPLHNMALNLMGLLISRTFSLIYSRPSVSPRFTSPDSVNAESQVYPLLYTILYKELEHPKILVSTHEGPENQSPQILRDECS